MLIKLIVQVELVRERERKTEKEKQSVSGQRENEIMRSSSAVLKPAQAGLVKI